MNNHEKDDHAGGGGDAAAKQDHTESDINVYSFEELHMDAHIAFAAQESWLAFLSATGTLDTVGEAIFQAVFESAPSLQNLFTTARAVHVMRFMGTLNSCFMSISDPPALKLTVETLAFGHMHIDVLVEHVKVFRSAITDLVSMEMADQFSSSALQGFTEMLNYIGGAIIYVKSHYADRVRILKVSWQKANNKASNEATFVQGSDTEETEESDEDREFKKAARLKAEEARAYEEAQGKKRSVRIKRMFRRGSHNKTDADAMSLGQKDNEHQEHSGNKNKNMNAFVQHVPTVYPEMFRFNAAVMGFGTSIWMSEVLEVFGNLVSSMARPAQLREECDMLALRIAKITKDPNVNLTEYRACMLASLRSLLPKDWSPAHEVAWTWLWDNVQRLVTGALKNTATFEKKIEQLLASFDEDSRYTLRSAVYDSFFVAAPAGQDYFKQSITRLHFIADRVLDMCLEIFQDPAKMVDVISALGLRHVGYGIPIDLFAPFVSAVLEELGSYSKDLVALEAFKFALGLITSMLVRTITEGSTIVMKSINANSASMLRKSISQAPRGQRATWMLKVQVGSQSISPLEWAIESGRLMAAQAVLEDLLTFRADREAYYYGMEQLFTRHPDIIKIITASAPSLLPILLEGLIWRSRNTTNGIRRANYYVKYLVVKQDGGVSQALHWFAQSGNCQIITHPVNVLVSDTMWKGIVRRHFLLGRIWFILSLVVFLLSQAILPSFASNEDSMTYVRVLIFCGRCITFFGSLFRLAWRHTRNLFLACLRRDFVWVVCLPVPKYFTDFLEVGSFFLLGLLIAMISTEPMLRCSLASTRHFPTSDCPESAKVEWWYSIFSMLAMVMHYVLIIDMSVFSTKLSAFLLVCTTVLSEVSRFMIALFGLLMTFGSAIACLKRDNPDFRDVPNCVLSLFAVTLLMMPRDYRELQYDPWLLLALFLFVTASVILLLNLLIAQLNCSYEFIYQDMVGFARLKRAAAIVESLTTCSSARWDRFVGSLKLENRIEFNEGDVGIPGAIQLLEPASLNPITTEQIQRYGGVCNPEMKWPEDKDKNNLDRLDRMEVLVRKMYRKLGAQQGKRADKGTSSGSDSASYAESGMGSDSSGSEMNSHGRRSPERQVSK